MKQVRLQCNNNLSPVGVNPFRASFSVETDFLKPDGKPNSHCHPMFGSVLTWFYKYVAGLNFDKLYQGVLSVTPKYFDKGI